MDRSSTPVRRIDLPRVGAECRVVDEGRRGVAFGRRVGPGSNAKRWESGGSTLRLINMQVENNLFAEEHGPPKRPFSSSMMT